MISSKMNFLPTPVKPALPTRLKHFQNIRKPNCAGQIHVQNFTNAVQSGVIEPFCV